jgi:hypothetical protein
MVLFNASGREDEVVPLSLLDAPGGVQSFSLTFDGSKVSASIGREHRAFSMQAAAPVVRIVCSTGEFLFTNLSIEPSK